ncbi:MAG: methyl-accepting chemotaxis sensory transducer, partial [Chthoniobacteraceae bacterium]|nr:methyl-accepting chemotaxis sensory transducer [Chthoniobacteraceae bacterium]
ESGVQGFLLTTGDAHLASYHVALNEISSEAAVVRNLTADNAAQRQNFQQLDPLMAAMLAVVAQCISLQQRGERNAALRSLNADHGKQSMEAIRAVLQQMEAEEQRLLVSRSEHLAAQARMSTRILFFLVTLNMLFAGLVFILYRRLSKLRGLVTVCAWSHTVEYQGEWFSFETYLLRRFGLNTSHGISPVEAERVFGCRS